MGKPGKYAEDTGVRLVRRGEGFPMTRRAVVELYRRKLVHPSEAVQCVRSGDNIVLPLGCGEPPALLEALTERKDELEGVVIHQMLPMRTARYLEPGMEKHFRHNSWFTSNFNRQAVNEGRADFTPGNFHEFPRILEEYFDVDVFMGTVSPMDERGFFSFGVSVDYTLTAAAKAKIVILEINEHMPYTRGNSLIHICDVDYLVHNDTPLPELTTPPLTEEDKAIGAYVADLVEDGSTIQLGIGVIPNGVTRFLMDKKDLGVHSEMLVDGMLDLIESGVINNRRKTLHRGKAIASFALGTKRLYDFVHDNAMVEMHPVSYVNDPYVIGQNYKMVSINSSLEVDLLGQCASESIGPRIFSATGGQNDFARGALRSEGGKSIVTLHSTARGGTIPRIVPTLKQGAIVTVTKNDVDYVVTEYGVAKLRGKTARERALALISIAHPDFRDELRQHARKMMLI